MNIFQFARAGWVLSSMSHPSPLKSVWDLQHEKYLAAKAKWDEVATKFPALASSGAIFDGSKYVYKPYATLPFKTDADFRATIQALLEGKQGVFIASTNSTISQYRTSCILKEIGFRRAGSMCKMNSSHSNGSTQCPGVPDRRSHWTHIWYLLQNPPTTLEAHTNPHLGGCQNYGLKVSTEGELISCPWKDGICVAVAPTAIKLPTGWRSFYRFTDQKLVHNLSIGLEKGNSQKCAHKFLLSEFDGWTPADPACVY